MMPEADDIIAVEWRGSDEETEQAFDAITDLRSRLDDDLEDATCNVLLYAKRGRHLEDRFRRVAMTENLGQVLKENLDTSLREFILKCEDGPDVIRPYGFGEHVEGSITYMPVNAFAAITDFHANLPPDTWEPEFQSGEKFAAKLRAIYYSVHFLNPRNRVLMAQTASETKVFHRGITARLVNNRFEHLRSEDALTFLPSFDFFIWNNFVFMDRPDKFEALLDFRHETKNIARNVFEGLVAALPVSDQDGILQLLLERTRHTKKLAKLSQADYLPNLTMESITAQIDEHGLPMSVQNIDGVDRVVLDDPTNPNSAMELLRLLDDDLWRSAMTGNRYVARAKDARG